MRSVTLLESGGRRSAKALAPTSSSLRRSVVIVVEYQCPFLCSSLNSSLSSRPWSTNFTFWLGQTNANNPHRLCWAGSVGRGFLVALCNLLLNLSDRIPGLALERTIDTLCGGMGTTRMGRTQFRSIFKRLPGVVAYSPEIYSPRSFDLSACSFFKLV